MEEGQIVTLKEMEEKYGWGFVLLRNPIRPEGYAYITGGEYLFHSQSKDECWDKFDEFEKGHLGIMPFGVNPEFKNINFYLPLNRMPGNFNFITNK